MARSEISEKLSLLIKENDWDEPRVLYIFVQLRKILDHRDDRDNYTILRFYCDWVVHISKDYITKETIGILKEIEKDATLQIRTGGTGTSAAINFVYLDYLKPEIRAVLQRESIDPKEIFEELNWEKLVVCLSRILENQPLQVKDSYGLNIRKIEFKPTDASNLTMLVYFNEPIKSKTGEPAYWFRLTNYV